MKKIIFGLLIAFVALSFMGCPTVYEKDYEYASATAYYAGSSNDWTFDLMAFNEANGKCEIEVEVVEGDNFKLTATDSWSIE